MKQMSKTQVKELREQFNGFGEQIAIMIKTVEKYKEWAERVSNSEEIRDEEEYSLACHIVCFEEGLDEMEKQM